MSKRDVLILPKAQGPVVFDVYGAEEDVGWLLLQRLYILLLSDQDSGYRNSVVGSDLLSLLEGSNTPPDEVFTSVLALACDTALRMLDEDDQKLIASFKGNVTNGIAVVTLELTDGTTLTGLLNNG